MLVMLVVCIIGAVIWLVLIRTGRMERWGYLPKVVVALSCLGLAALAMEDSQVENGTLTRAEPGETEQTYDLAIKVPGLTGEESYEVTVPARSYSEKQVEKVLENAQKELEETMCGDNENLSEIKKDMNLPQSLQNNSVEASYECSEPDLLESDGTVIYENTTKEGNAAILYVTLHCQDQEMIVEYPIVIKEDQSDVLKLVKKRITKEILSQVEDSPQSETIELPKEIGNWKIIWSDKAATKPGAFVFLIILIIIALEVARFSKERERERKRKKQLVLEYPNFLNTLTLLLGAGMNVRRAFERIVEKQDEYTGERSELQKELKITCMQMQGGVGEMQAYEKFAARCDLQQYRKLVGILLQNMKKGSRKLRELLDGEAILALEEQKALARKRGEEVSTKLLLPMMLLLAIVMVILMFPVAQI
ncbi:MAG: type II secretion system F family protein [Eubacterium sp.]|nr:type II secretion system F family protein [Eubacterium sp.]